MQTLIQTFNIQRDGGYRKKSHCDFFMTICTRESGIIFSEVGVAKCSSSARGDVWTAQSIWEVPIHKTRSLNLTTNWTPVYVSTYAVTASWIVYCPLLSETDEKSPFEPRVCAKSNWNASKIRANFQKQLAQCHFGLLAVGSVVSENATRLYLLTSTRKEMRTSSQIFLPSQISNQYNNDSAFVFIFYKKPPWSHKLCT